MNEAVNIGVAPESMYRTRSRAPLRAALRLASLGRILIRMQDSTSVRVSTSTRDAVRRLADADEVTLDEEIARLARSERQRRMGLELSQPEPDDDTRAWIEAGVDSVTNALG